MLTQTAGITRTRGFEILHEDGELLVLSKPAGLVCHPTKGDEYSSLIGRLRLYLGSGAAIHLINRLDRETGGLVLVAKADAAAASLRRLWEARQVRKEYLAIVHGHMASDEGLIDAPLGKDESSKVAIKDCVRPGGAPSSTAYRVRERFTREERRFSLVEAVPETGRKHQIRIHLSHIGHPIVGDKIYGGDEGIYLALVEGRIKEEDWKALLLPNHALHAARVAFSWRGREWEFESNPEAWFLEFLPTGRTVG